MRCGVVSTLLLNTVPIKYPKLQGESGLIGFDELVDSFTISLATSLVYSVMARFKRSGGELCRGFRWILPVRSAVLEDAANVPSERLSLAISRATSLEASAMAWAVRVAGAVCRGFRWNLPARTAVLGDAAEVFLESLLLIISLIE